MNIPFHSRAGHYVFPCLALLFTSPIWRPTSIEAQGCGSCAASSGAYNGLSRAFPTLNQQFGGSEAPRPVRLTNTGPQTVSVETRGTTTTLTGPTTRYVDASGTGGEAQALPGEPASTAVTTPNDNGTTPGAGDNVKKEDPAEPKCPDSTGNIPPAESTTPTPAQGAPPQITPGQSDPQPGNADHGGAAPPPATPPAPSDPAPLRPTTANEYQGTAFQTDPGGAIPINGSGGLSGATDAPPNVMMAVSLGQRAGYLVPKSNRGIYGGGNPAKIGPERIGYYTARGFSGIYYDGLATTLPLPSPVTNDLRWHTSSGLTILTQETANKARIDVYPPYEYDSTTTGLPLNSGATIRRSTSVEKLTTGNPDTLHYTTGYLVRTAVTGFPVKLETTWTGDVVTSGANQLIYSRITRALEGIPGSSTHETVSTRVGNSLDRTIDLTTTEVVQQPAYNGGAPAVETIVTRSREKRTLFPWGEETVETTTNLTPSTSGPSLTAYTQWYDVPQTDANYSQPRLKIAQDGQWTAFFKGVPDAGATSTGPFLAGSITGWKNTAAPTAVTTATGLAALASTAGYNASLTSTRFGQNPLRTERYENGVLVNKSEDLTADQAGRQTFKRWANASDFFITVTTRYPSGVVRDVFELKKNLIPADLNVDPDPAQLFGWRHSSNGAVSGYTTTVDNALHIPSTGSYISINPTSKLLQSMDRLMVTAINTDGSPLSQETLCSETWTYDDRGRPFTHNKDGQINESWLYPTEFEVDYTDASGIRHWMQYEPQGRLVREVMMPSGTQTISDMPGSPVLNAAVLTRYYTTEWFYRAPTLTGSVSNTLKLETSKTSVNGNPLSVGSWRREWVEHIDGLGRAISTLDPLNTTRNISYTHGATGTDITTSIPSSPVTTVSVASIFLSGQQKAQIYPTSTNPLLGKAGSDVFFDYSSAPYASTVLADRYNTFNATNGYESRTTDGLDRVVSTVKAIGMSGTALNLHDEIQSYDDQSRLLSRKLPRATTAAGSLYEVYAYADVQGWDTGTYGLETKKALSTDSAWSAGDANQTITTAFYSPEDGFWGFDVHETAPEGQASWTKRGMGAYSGLTETTSLGVWDCIGVDFTERDGMMVMEYRYHLPGAALTRMRRYSGEGLRLSITSCNGLPLLYDTNGTTYSSKIASFTILREPLSSVGSASGYWPYRSIASNTGLVSYDYTPGGQVKNYYSYFMGSDVRAGLVSSNQTYASPGGITYYDYNARGQRIREWGTGASPSETGYDALGRMTSLSTYRTGTWTASTWPASPPSADTTQWTYPPTLSLQLSKIYPDAGGQDTARRTTGYSYHPNGALATRTWQRMPGSFSNTAAGAGVVTNYVYDAYARLQTIDYPAATTTVAATPDVSFTYDTAGRISTRTEAGQATTTYLYKAWGTPWKETVASLTSALPSSVVERTYDAYNRLDLLKVQAGGVTAPNVDYNFNATTSLLDNVVTDSRTMAYGYNGIGAAPTALTYAHSGSTLLSTLRPLNSDGLVSGITHSQPSPATLFQSMTYGYSVNQVTSMTRGAEEDSMSWNYRYDNRMQVTSADKTFPNGEFAAGLQTEYGYDMAGNRTSKSQGGSATTVEGTGVRSTSYGTANALNQYTALTNPNSSGSTWLDIAGRRSASTETIKVNSVVAGYQQNTTTGLQFRRELTVSPNTWNSVSITSTTGSTTTTLDSGYQFAPPTAETLTYDADGNLLSDGRWAYKWDAENRLASLSKQNPASAPYYTWTYTFYYDGLSRRTGTKIDWYFTPSLSYYMTEYDAFVFDGWNLVMDGKNSSGIIAAASRRSYVWGPDLGSPTHGHSSWQKAGGVGGLLCVLSSPDTNCMFPLMDRLGNVTGYRKAVSGTPAVLSAVFEYDAFGREVRSTGPASDAMRFRFSTKYHHGGPYTETDTGLIYYGYRFYDPDRGRWINRDPIGETGGMNLYGGAANNFILYIDTNGLSITSGPGGDINNNLPPGPTPPSQDQSGPKPVAPGGPTEWGGLDFPLNWFDPGVKRDCDSDYADCMKRGAAICSGWSALMGMYGGQAVKAFKTARAIAAAENIRKADGIKEGIACATGLEAACLAGYEKACKKDLKACQDWNTKHHF